MVLSYLFNPFKKGRKAWEMAFLGALYSTTAIFVSLWTFKSQASLVMVFLNVIAIMPLFYSFIRHQELVGEALKSEREILKQHGRTLLFLLFLFLGTVISYAFWFVVLPPETSSNLFSIQTATIINLNNELSAAALGNFSILSKIFLNNLRVLILSIAFSLLYGAGSIFIIIWNSSLIGTAAGIFIQKYVTHNLALSGAPKTYLLATVGSALRYLFHGIPEILAYFVGALAGGILSVAIIKKEFETPHFERIIVDVADLTLIAILLLFVAALLEVYVTPLFF
ncbi:MAG: stage II sporulation protein M [Candidatus Woesearchaeota archaeon]